jgi:signal transduction histidine kinase
MIQVTIRDYGQGIPPDQAPLLFNRFVRLPRDLASSISGNGLGLYLCRLYVEAMGGRIWLTSSGQPGDGSAFQVLLPAAPTGNGREDVTT